MNTNNNTVVYIQIEGLIGVGKSSLIQNLAERPYEEGRNRTTIVMDQPEDIGTWNFSATPGTNGLLDEFLDTKDSGTNSELTTAANLQAVIFSSFLRQGRETANMIECNQQFGDVIIIQERSIRASTNVFLPLQRVKQEDRNMLEALGAEIEKRLPEPDLVFYLEASPEVCLTRTQERGRKYEDNYTLEYYYEMENLYSKLLHDYGMEGKLHRIGEFKHEINNTRIKIAARQILSVCWKKLDEKKKIRDNHAEGDEHRIEL